MFKFKKSPTGRRITLAVLSAVFVISGSIIVAYTALTPSGVSLAVGQVAPDDILAPHSITYPSDVLTRLARQSAADGISAIYDPPNPTISRQQIQLARHI